MYGSNFRHQVTKNNSVIIFNCALIELLTSQNRQIWHYWIDHKIKLSNEIKYQKPVMKSKGPGKPIESIVHRDLWNVVHR